MSQPEDARNRIHREEQVAELHDHKSSQHGRGMSRTVGMLDEPLPFCMRIVRDHHGQESHHQGFVIGMIMTIVVIVVLLIHLPSGPEQDSAEDVDHGMHVLQEPNACEDEDQAEDDSSPNAPFEYWPLVVGMNAETFEDHGDHHKVVHAERFLYEVTSDKYKSDLTTTEYAQEYRKPKGEPYPTNTGNKCA
eukprot:CAMPEP_0115755724 /NCGR_PEP_ID=MMETSP0272-20121206/97541_1 /TAXON_ID=71861 /ORGANISM="Scrippsiella trochoidea, Strain CCMP3099" /LENGTH=190 /DNA_ID=CAMNT_0003201187 /DNA_START=249 /DNA_END=817 /DNA_ORIENTATION=+